MNLVDVLILIFIIVGGLAGFREGFTKSVVKFLGLIIVLILSFLLKNFVSGILMRFFPFIPFSGFIKGVTVLNIAFYEVIAFALVFSILMVVLKILSTTSSIFEKVLSFTIILGIPSKILGALVGLVRNYIVVFFVLYFLAMPNFSGVSVIEGSKYKDSILRKTPFLSEVADTSIKVFDEFKDLSLKYKGTDSANEFNLETLDLFLKYKITSVDTVKYLRDSGKIKIDGIDEVIKKYEGK